MYVLFGIFADDDVTVGESSVTVLFVILARKCVDE